MESPLRAGAGADTRRRARRSTPPSSRACREFAKGNQQSFHRSNCIQDGPIGFQKEAPARLRWPSFVPAFSAAPVKNQRTRGLSKQKSISYKSFKIPEVGN